jgi:hypothetical protein
MRSIYRAAGFLFLAYAAIKLSDVDSAHINSGDYPALYIALLLAIAFVSFYAGATSDKD